MARDLAGIILEPMVGWVKAAGYSLTGDQFRYYPDGSVRWLGDSDFSRTFRQLLQYQVPGAYGNSCFRPLAVFGGGLNLGTVWDLTYPGSYGHFLGEFDELGLGLGPGAGRLVAAFEHDPARVQVGITMYRKITHKIADELAVVVKQWFSEIGSKGVFGEEGVRSLSHMMHYSGRQAYFEINATDSGQETLNTFYLAVLNWGITKRQPLLSIDLAAEWREKLLASEKQVPLK